MYPLVTPAFALFRMSQGGEGRFCLSRDAAGNWRCKRAESYDPTAKTSCHQTGPNAGLRNEDVTHEQAGTKTREFCRSPRSPRTRKRARSPSPQSPRSRSPQHGTTRRRTRSPSPRSPRSIQREKSLRDFVNHFTPYTQMTSNQCKALIRSYGERPERYKADMLKQLIELAETQTRETQRFARSSSYGWRGNGDYVYGPESLHSNQAVMLSDEVLDTLNEAREQVAQIARLYEDVRQEEFYDARDPATQQTLVDLHEEFNKAKEAYEKLLQKNGVRENTSVDTLKGVEELDEVLRASRKARRLSDRPQDDISYWASR